MALWQNNGMAIGTPHEWQGLLEDVSNRLRLVEDATEDAWKTRGRRVEDVQKCHNLVEDGTKF